MPTLLQRWSVQEQIIRPRTWFCVRNKRDSVFRCCEDTKLSHAEVFVLENVKNLISHDKGNTFETIRSNLEALGYSVSWEVINAIEFVPQNRERIFIVGVLGINKFSFSSNTWRSTSSAFHLDSKLKGRCKIHDFGSSLAISPRLQGKTQETWEWLWIQQSLAKTPHERSLLVMEKMGRNA